MDTVFPAPLAPGDVVGVTSPSSGVPKSLHDRREVSLDAVRVTGLQIERGTCMDGSGVVSAPAADRAHEFQRMLLDPLDPRRRPRGTATSRSTSWATWVVGFSDMSTLLTPLTLL